MRAISFDISSTTIGYAVFEYDEVYFNLLKCSYLKPSKNKKLSLFDKFSAIKKEINKLFDEYKPEEIIIEEIIKYFPGASSANTIITLAVWNRMIGLYSYEYFNKSPHLFTALAVRHGIKRQKQFPTKEEIPALVKTYVGNLDFPLNKKGELKTESYDMADAIALGLFFILKEQGKIKKK